MEGYKDRFNNMERLKNVAEAVRINFTILEVQGLESSIWTTWNNLKMVVDHVEQQDEKLANFEVIRTEFLLKEAFFSLQRMSKKWKVKEMEVAVNSLPWRPLINLDDLLTASSLDDGHISSLFVHWYKDWELANLNALRRLWEISDEMWINENVLLKGGRGEDREEAWQRVIDYFHLVNGNNND